MAGPSLQGLLNPAMLRWAREQSRMSLDAAAHRIGQASEKLHEWEEGQRIPTLSQVRLLAGIYKRSVGIFFLREIPKVPRRPADYRRIELSSTDSISPRVANGIRECEAKREAALDIYAELETQPPEWSLALNKQASPEKAAQFITEALGVTLTSRRAWHNVYDALNGWKAAVEAQGALVFQISGVSVSEMRGCSISLRPLPIIILNGSDTPLGRVFTLLHEVTHIARGESTLCDLVEEGRQSASEAVEAYCNHVAGAVLIPQQALLSEPDVSVANEQSEWTNDRLEQLRRVFWASRETVLRRLLINKKTSSQFYRQMREQFEREYKELRETQDSGPVPFYRKVIMSNGKSLTRLALLAYGSHTITGTELSRILNTKLDHLPDIRKALSGEAAA